MRVGIGYDVHPLVSGRKLIVGGVEIPYERGLDGHSDADVLTHAIMDSMLGAMGLGDIGQHFSDRDLKYKDADSILLLREISKLMEVHGYEVVNIDSVIIAQEPRFAPFILEMKTNISAVLGVDVSRIGIKATTTEKLGFIGEKQGIASQAVALLRRKNGYNEL